MTSDDCSQNERQHAATAALSRAFVSSWLLGAEDFNSINHSPTFPQGLGGRWQAQGVFIWPGIRGTGVIPDRSK